MQYFDSKSAYEINHSSFSDSLQADEGATSSEGGGISSQDDTMEAIFGADEAAREELLHIEVRATSIINEP